MKYLNNSTFVNNGYLNEMNRLFLNPLGLCMVLENNELKILDHRDKKEGPVINNLDEYSKAKSQLILEEFNDRCLYRLSKYGWKIQPLNIEEDI